MIWVNDIECRLINLGLGISMNCCRRSPVSSKATESITVLSVQIIPKKDHPVGLILNFLEITGLANCTVDPKDRNDLSNIAKSSPPDNEDVNQELEDPASGLTNPLSTGPPAFMSAENGRTCTLATRIGLPNHSNISP